MSKYNKATSIFLCMLNFLMVHTLHSFSVIPIFETEQVAIDGDADDPAIWVNNINIDNSLVFGTDKYNGIYTYNLVAETINFSPSGNINNIDIISLENLKTSLLFGSNRDDSSLDLWILDHKKINSDIASNSFNLSKVADYKGFTNMIVYGVCAGYHEVFGNIAFITEDEGSRVQMWSYANNLKLIHTFNNQNATQSEGCVYDSENETLFISEEQDRGILRAYKVDEGLDFSSPMIVDTRSGRIVGDPEGITIYKKNSTEGYVILSSQGNSTFNIYNRIFPYNFINSFTVEGNEYIDSTSDTDGLDVVNINLGEDFPSGLLVIQDGNNEGKNLIKKQNFKFISIKDVLDNL